MPESRVMGTGGRWRATLAALSFTVLLCSGGWHLPLLPLGAAVRFQMDLALYPQQAQRLARSHCSVNIGFMNCHKNTAR